MQPTHASLRIAVDIGGTFTDMACFDEATGQISFGKALSTHGHLHEGIQNTLDGAGVDLSRGYLFLHGSTIAINTLLERNGANTALLITEGFRDIYEIGRVNRQPVFLEACAAGAAFAAPRGERAPACRWLFAQAAG